MTRTLCSRIGLVLLAAGSIGAARQSRSEASNHLAAARAAQAAGDITRALTEYEAAEAALEAAGGSAEALKFDVLLNHARLLVSAGDQLRSTPPGATPTTGAANGGASHAVVEAERLYRRLLGSGTASQQNLVRNELGTLMLAENRAREAVPVFDAIQFDADPSRRFVYRFNAGRAHEGTGDTSGAASRYVDAVVDKAEFEPAVDAAIAALSRTFSGPDADRLVWKLVQARQIHDLDRATKTLIPVANSSAAAVSLISARLIWEVEAKIDREAFVRSEQELLTKTRANVGATIGDVVARSYLDDALAVPRGGNGPMTNDFYKLLGMPTPPRSLNAVALPVAYARVVKHTGDLYEARELHSQALARYLYAWAFDQSDGASAVSAAALIKQHSELDADNQVLNSLIERIFVVKGAAIAADDVANSLRLHVVLATIFEGLGKWLPENDSHTALFQWKAAAADEARISRTDTSHQASPGIYMHLAECYRRAGQPALASKNYSLAGDAFKAAHRDEEAASAYSQARQ